MIFICHNQRLTLTIIIDHISRSLVAQRTLADAGAAGIALCSLWNCHCVKLLVGVVRLFPDAT